MATLNLDFHFKTLNGEEIGGNTAAKLVAEILVGRTEGLNATKAMYIARKLYDDGSIELDPVDLEALEKVINNAEIANIVKAPLLDCIKEAGKTNA